jgi:MIP family channel proteins
MDRDLMRAALAEFFGTFTLVFVGAAAVASGQGVAVAALAHGIILAAIIYTYGHISGAHVNPAVTAGVFVARKIEPLRAVIYWIAQFLGGIAAALLLSVLIADRTNVGQTVGSLTGSAPWSAAAVEVVVTFFLVSAVIQAAVYGRAGNFAGLAIGFTLLASIAAVGTYTGASLNPARTLGPALVAGDLSYLLPYFVGMFGGGVLAGLVHRFILGND